jgi:hypothetical protein
MGGFQNVVNAFPAPGVEGDFASANPRASALAGPGGLVCGPGGVAVGRFAWVNTSDNITASNFGTAPNAPDGFVHRDQQALITKYLGIASLLVPQGFPITLMRSGDFWVRNYGPSALTKGVAVYAGYADGKAYSAAPTGASVTGAVGSTNTGAIGSTFTASAGTNPLQLVVTAVTGLISIGDELAGTGITPGTTVVSQVSGTVGGAGTYLLSETNTTSAATVTSFGNVLKTSSTTNLISIGDTVSGGSGFPVGAVVVSQVSGTVGGAGVYTLSAPATSYVASATGVTTFSNVVNVTVVGSGVLAPGQPISGTNIPAAAAIASQVSGAVGGVGVYTLTVPTTQYVTSATLTTTGGIASGWYAYPTSPGDGAVGSLVKISNNSAGL